MKKKAPAGKYAWAVKIGDRGQFVIPKQARDLFDIQPGDTLLVLADEKRGIAIPPKSMFTSLALRVFGDEDVPVEGNDENEDENGNENGDDT